MQKLPRLFAFAVSIGLLLVGLTTTALADRPAAPKLLPEKTLAYFRVADAAHLGERFSDTAIGRMVQDEQMKPLVGQLYGTLQNAFKQIEDRVGLPLDQLLKLPQGEICVAFVAPPEKSPGLVVLFDVKDQLPQFEKLLAKGEEFLRENGGRVESEKVADQDVTAYSGPGGNTVYLLKREGTLLVSNSKEVMEYTLKTWNGGGGKTLADNNNFNSIMSRCAGAVDDPPQITFFVDPIELVRTVARGGIAATGLALLPVLGLDGLKGVGGSITFASGEFDDVQHFHILLDNPRAGVVQLLAMKPGNTTPEAWVPVDVITYNTINWDFKLTFDKGASLYNSLAGDNEFQMEVQRRISERLGVDFEKDVLPAMEGRVTFCQWVEKPVRINSIASLVGVKLKDPQAFQATFQKVLDKFPDATEKKFFGGTPYWTVKVPEGAGRGPFGRGDNPNGPALRRPEPCLTLLGDYLLGSDSPAALQAAITTAADPKARLANELDFKLIASKIKRQVGGDAPGMIQFSRPEEGMRFWYDMAAAEDTKRLLAAQAEDNPFFRDVDKALKDNPLPPFAVLSKYLAPGGGMMVNDETGLHYMTFTLKRQAQ